MARHYETIIIVAPEELALGELPGVLPKHDVIYCARLGYTRHADLKKAIQGIRLAGGTPLGVVLWDDVDPAPVAPETFTPPSPRHDTAEMEAFVAGRAR
jgi:hypothetical protein